MNPDAELDRQPLADRPHRPLRRWWLIVVPALLLTVMAGTVSLVVAVRDGDGAAVHAVPAGPLSLGAVSDTVAAHYRYAAAHETEFVAIPCFCGCEEFLGHRHLYDCFIRTDGVGYDGHAAGCGVCIAEATVAAERLDRGVPALEVAALIVARFGSTPATSPDQTAPDRPEK